MDYTEIPSAALGIEKPWIIREARLETTGKGEEMHVYTSFSYDSLFPCPVCGRKYALDGFVKNQWRHFNFFQYPCYIHSESPAIKCSTHGLQFVEIPWKKKGEDFVVLS